MGIDTDWAHGFAADETIAVLRERSSATRSVRMTGCGSGGSTVRFTRRSWTPSAAVASITPSTRERARLARELHDSVSPSLFSMAMQARAAQLALDDAGLDHDGPLGRSVAQLSVLSRSAAAELRAVILELAPEGLAELGLVQALRVRAAAAAAQALITIEVTAPGKRLVIAPPVERQLYRIACEALHNAVKHSSAGRAVVKIADDAGQITVTVSDDGVGFDLAERRSGCLGLSTMQSRAAEISGTLTVTSSTGAGTTVRVSAAAHQNPRRGLGQAA